MKDVTIKITGTHIHDNIEEEQMEFITEAKMYMRNDVLYLVYDEGELSGLEGVRTRLRIDSNNMRMSRVDGEKAQSEMYFEKGKRFEDRYHTPMGPIEVEILTNSFFSTMTYEGKGRVDVEYSISLKGMSEGRSKLGIEFLGETGNEQ